MTAWSLIFPESIHFTREIDTVCGHFSRQRALTAWDTQWDAGIRPGTEKTPHPWRCFLSTSNRKIVDDDPHLASFTFEQRTSNTYIPTAATVRL